MAPADQEQPAPPVKAEPMTEVQLAGLEDTYAHASHRELIGALDTKLEARRLHILAAVAEIRRLKTSARCELCGAECCPCCSFREKLAGYVCAGCMADTPEGGTDGRA